MFAVRYQVFDKDDRRVTKEREFKTEAARAAWVARQEETNDAWSGVLAWSD